MNSPLRILSTALAGTGGRADDKTSGTALPTGAGPRLLRGVANSEAREDMSEIGVAPPGVEETTGKIKQNKTSKSYTQLEQLVWLYQ